MKDDLTKALDTDARKQGCAPDLPPLPGKPLSELHLETPDPNELIKDRFLSLTSGALLVAPTGVGKSSFVMQIAICWSVGVATWGLVPARPMSIWIIQAENDEGDLVEEREGICEGLVAEQLDPSQVKKAQEGLRIITEVTVNGEEFGRWLKEKLKLAKQHDALPDLIIVDPVFSFLGGDSLYQRDVTHFLRNILNPVLFKFHIACILVHHTNKPSSPKERKVQALMGDLAYLGAGSAEWANWPRAILAIEKTENPEIFRLHAAKRGRRLGWRDNVGSPTYARYIAHALEEGQIYWREPPQEEIDQIPAKRSRSTANPVDRDKIIRKANPPIGKTELREWVRSHFGVGRARAGDHVKMCLEAGTLREVTVSIDPHYKLIGLPEEVEKEAKRREGEYRLKRYNQAENDILKREDS